MAIKMNMNGFSATHTKALGSFLSTDGVRGSTFNYATVIASSNSTDAAGASTNEVDIVFQPPTNPKTKYQAFIYNPSTFSVTYNFYTELPTMSTIAANNWVFMDTTDIGNSSTVTYYGMGYKQLDGIFNGGALKVSMVAKTSGSSDSTKSTFRVAIREWY